MSQGNIMSSTRIASLFSELVELWARHGAIERTKDNSRTLALATESQSNEADRRRIEHAILTACPTTTEDAQRLAILVRAYEDAISDADVAAQQAGTAALVDFMANQLSTSNELEMYTGGKRDLTNDALPIVPRPRSLRERFESLKSRRPGVLLAFSTGQWFEFYGCDAMRVSEALGIVLATMRDGEGGTIANCSIPASTVGRLLRHSTIGQQRLVFVSFDQFAPVADCSVGRPGSSGFLKGDAGSAALPRPPLPCGSTDHILGSLQRPPRAGRGLPYVRRA